MHRLMFVINEQSLSTASDVSTSSSSGYLTRPPPLGSRVGALQGATTMQTVYALNQNIPAVTLLMPFIEMISWALCH
jgi:hypothetical protein